MNIKMVKRVFYMGLICISAGAVRSGEGWWVKGGGVYRGGMEMQLRGSSIVQERGLHAANPGTSAPGNVGPQNAFANRTYDNGFVNIDNITRLSEDELEKQTGFKTTGLTTFWGYESNQQRPGNQITFSRTGPQGLKRTETHTTELGGEQSISGLGVELAAGRAFRVRENHRWDLFTGLRFFPLGKNTVSGIPYAEMYEGQVIEVTDTYKVPEVEFSDGSTRTPNTPSAPFKGSMGAAGNFDHLMPNRPSQRSTRTISEGSWTAENRVAVDVDSDIFEFRLGPQYIGKTRGKYVVTFLPALTVNVLDVDVTRREDFVAVMSTGREETIREFRNSYGSTEVLLGVSVECGVSMAISRRWGLGLNGGYNWVENTSIDAGPNRVEMDISGYSVGVSLIYTFGDNP